MAAPRPRVEDEDGGAAGRWRLERRRLERRQSTETYSVLTGRSALLRTICLSPDSVSMTAT